MKALYIVLLLSAFSLQAVEIINNSKHTIKLQYENLKFEDFKAHPKLIVSQSTEGNVLYLSEGESCETSNACSLKAVSTLRGIGQVAANNIEAHYPVTRYNFFLNELTYDTQITFVGQKDNLRAHILNKRTGASMILAPLIETYTETDDYWPGWTML